MNNSEQYLMLYENNPDNPFYNCNDNFDYDTDKEIDTTYIRICVIWNYEINYDFFSVDKIKCFVNKTDTFFDILQNIKDYQLSLNKTGIILKYPYKKDVKHLYLIVYYDNTKCNIDFYGLFNQELEENKLIENISLEKKYGTKGMINNICNSTNEYDFIVIHEIIEIE